MSPFSRILSAICLAVPLSIVVSPATCFAQLSTLETDDLTLIYVEPTQSFLAPHVGRSFENSLAFQRKLFDFTPSDKITVLLTDFADFGNASAESVPRNVVSVRIAPLSFAYETFTASERMNYLMNHELVHIATSDRAADRDLFFRRLFRGKVAPLAAHPETIGYFYVTSPRRAAPRWYLEGIAVFLDTWMAGGLGRAQGAYDEMVFRSMVRDATRFYDPLGLSSELTKMDFRLEANSYLYGTRFMDYLAYRYSPESLVRWASRTKGSSAYYASQFRRVYGMSLEEAWRQWVAFEHEFQASNLAAIRQHPVTTYEDISRQALGSVSRAFVDAEAGKLYVGLNYPGAVGYVGAISMSDGSIEKLHDIKEPKSYIVTSLAYDPASHELFYTADNTAYRDLMALDPRTKRERMLIRDARIGEIVFNQKDRSLWGIRTLNGICTLVRIPYPYSEWNKVYSWPYGETVYDLDLSSDGELVSASVGEISGKQTVRIMKTASLAAEDATPLKQFDFGTAIPSNFVFSADDRFLYGSSYYSGVSNIFRYEIANGDVQALSNTDTGFFRPTPYTAETLVVFRYTGNGFVPAIVPAKPIEDVSAITFLGEQLVEKHPVLKTWAAGSPGSVPIESMITKRGPYRPLKRLGLESIYPVVEGYKDTAGYGMHLRWSDPIQLNGASLTASYSPAGDIAASERLHVVGEYHRYDWDGRVAWNAADFYDLFGPTKRSRRGYAVEVGHLNTLVFDAPRRLELKMRGRFAGRLDQLPEYQNVPVAVDTLATATADLSYSNVRASLGSVDDEKGQRWSLGAREDYANSTGFTKVHGTYDLGFALPAGHSSIWIRNSAGLSPQQRSDPFANFYFGGFGNNYVDRYDEKQYRQLFSFPGVELNSIGGRNFVKSIVEWNAPPVRFRRAGTPGFYVSWLRPAVFVGGLATNLDARGFRSGTTDAGAQCDIRMSALSNLDLTLSLGGAVAFDHGVKRHELMLSLAVLR